MARPQADKATAEEPLEKQLWKSAEKLRKNIDAAECTGEPGYADEKGFCASVAGLDHVLSPGRYVGLPDEDDDVNFAERFAALKAEFEAQLVEEARLNAAIADNLARVKL